MFKVEFQEVFSIEDCEANPHKLYVFGDNLLRKGSGPYSGQAVIRHCKNAHGVATKREPNNMPYAFFSDKLEEFRAVDIDLYRIHYKAHELGCTTLVFPKAGLGTGRACLAEKSPGIAKYIQEWLITFQEHLKQDT